MKHIGSSDANIPSHSNLQDTQLGKLTIFISNVLIVHFDGIMKHKQFFVRYSDRETNIIDIQYVE